MAQYKLRIRNAAQLVTVADQREQMKCGKDMDKVSVISNGTIVVGHDGLIAAVGTHDTVSAQLGDATFDQDIDATGLSILPGLVDGHTHPVWSGDRVHEFAMKLAGATYMDIHKAGGGIGFTVSHTRDSSEEELQALLRQRLDRMLAAGSTLVEAKSGYGLDVDTEMKMLRVMHSVTKDHPIELSPTFLGAHSVPKGRQAAEYTEEVVNLQLPELISQRDSGRLSVDNIDVFLEKGVFGGEDTQKILKAGMDLGLNANFHGDELNYMRSGELGAEMGVAAISHLEKVSHDGILAMASHKIVAVLLPTTAHILRLEPPPARAMIDNNVPVALGSDFNPNAHCLSMPFVMNLACITFRMTMNEALVASTLNAAASVKKSHTHGSLEVGKVGDILVIDAPRWEHLVYQIGNEGNLLKHIIKKGARVGGRG